MFDAEVMLCPFFFFPPQNSLLCCGFMDCGRQACDCSFNSKHRLLEESKEYLNVICRNFSLLLGTFSPSIFSVWFFSLLLSHYFLAIAFHFILSKEGAVLDMVYGEVYGREAAGYQRALQNTNDLSVSNDC